MLKIVFSLSVFWTYMKTRLGHIYAELEKIQTFLSGTTFP